MYLTDLPPREAQVGYGELGVRGQLGYEDKQVKVRGESYRHALSTHPPARLRFDLLPQRYTHFHSQVALNDDVAAGRSHADFIVLADRRRVAAALHVVAGEPPRPLHADVSGAETLELVVRTNRWEFCHAVWLDPRLGNGNLNLTSPDGTLIDCLGRTEIILPAVPPNARRCIATIVSPGFETLLDDMLGSLYANGGCQDALVVVFDVGDCPACEKVIAKYRATRIRCRPYAQVNATLKAALYTAARVVEADYFVGLDADMLVLGDLNPLFAALEACPPGAILACREGNGHGFRDLTHALTTVYGGRKTDFQRLLGRYNGEGSYSLVVNDGLFAAGREALLTLDQTIRAMPQAVRWTDERRNIWWRNQFVFNLALANLGCGVELDPAYNIQLNSQDVEFREVEGRVQAFWSERPARVLHFNGLGRHKYPKWRNLFNRVADPLVGAGGGDGYGQFLAALRLWLGRQGLAGLAWSFYGTADSHAARVSDPDTMPLLALLHYLIRANGCRRVLETGTARGVSAACLASAVAHRSDGHVVSFDPHHHPERDTLWNLLPEAMQACIEPRPVDSLAGLRAALEQGEQYDAALLDSLHQEEHVWAEFELAARLVCPGGLILIHDVQLPAGSVGAALQRIEAAGYGVTRLWTAECGVREDDGLGLAVIENRRLAKDG